jgi:phosphomannomutase/phosphoglucomutase
MDKLSPTIFREYDIRGLVDQDLTVEAVHLVGKALGTRLRAAGGRKAAVGRDARLSGERFRDAMISGLTSTGIDVLDLGIVPTPLTYFAAHTAGVDGICMITGSHNPPEYNGLKVGLGSATFHGEEIQALRRLADAGAGAPIDQTVRLDRTALAAAGVPPPAAAKRAPEPPAPPARPRRGWLLWAGVTIAALVAIAIALG